MSKNKTRDYKFTIKDVIIGFNLLRNQISLTVKQINNFKKIINCMKYNQIIKKWIIRKWSKGRKKYRRRLKSNTGLKF